MKKGKRILIGPLVVAGIALTSCELPWTQPCVYGPAPTKEITGEKEETEKDSSNNLECAYGLSTLNDVQYN